MTYTYMLQYILRCNSVAWKCKYTKYNHLQLAFNIINIRQSTTCNKLSVLAPILFCLKTVFMNRDTLLQSNSVRNLSCIFAYFIKLLSIELLQCGLKKNILIVLIIQNNCCLPKSNTTKHLITFHAKKIQKNPRCSR